MDMASSLILIANPGSASRKYALFADQRPRATLHFEWQDSAVICTLRRGSEQHAIPTTIPKLEVAASEVISLLHAQGVLKKTEQIDRIGLRIVAPGSYFLRDHVVDDDFAARLQAAESRAPLHITATLHELQTLREQFKTATIMGISDSAFHASKPDYAWNYGISLALADQHDIKRFGYHGLSVASVVHTLLKAEKLSPKLVVCHLGSGVSVTAVHGGKSIDTTMGYSPLEGVIMSTRSGSIDPTALRVLKEISNWDDDAVEKELNTNSGLLGLGGSGDVRELLQREAAGDHNAHLALQTYVFSIQKAIGSMAAALGGLDTLVFTGTVGERSAPIRERIMDRLQYLDLLLDTEANEALVPDITRLAVVSRLAHSKPVYVLPTDEAREMMHHF